MKTAILYFASLLMLFSACKSKAPEVTVEKSPFLEITKTQFQTEKMSVGTAVPMIFENSFPVSGKIVPGVNGLAYISVLVDGPIHKVLVQVGQLVRKGDPIFEITGSPLLELQQSFASSSAKMKQLKSDFERTKALYQEDIKTENEYMLSESAFKNEFAHYKALALKIENLGLRTKDIEEGKYVSSYTVRAPMQGQVVNMDAALGQYVQSQQNLATLVNSDKNQLKLAVFERDLGKVKEGQTVVFKSAGQNECLARATITRISQVLNPNSKSFECFAQIASSNTPQFLMHQLVQGEVILATDSVYAVPEEAIVKSANAAYVYVKHGMSGEVTLLDKQKVKLGRKSKGYVELVGLSPEKEILLSGTYYLGAE